MCAWQYTYNPVLREWNKDYSPYSVYFIGLGNCADDILNSPRSGGYKVAMSNSYIEQSYVKVWIGQSYNTDCFTHHCHQDKGTEFLWDEDEPVFITDYFSDEDRKELFTNPCKE